MIQTKICTKCGEEKEATSEFFHRHKSSKDGFRKICKVCRVSESKKYRDANKDKLSTKSVIYYAKNKTKIKTKASKYYIENKTKVLTRLLDQRKATAKTKAKTKASIVYTDRKNIYMNIYNDYYAGNKTLQNVCIKYGITYGQLRNWRKLHPEFKYLINKINFKQVRTSHRCSTCGELKPLIDYYASNIHKCKNCIISYNKNNKHKRDKYLEKYNRDKKHQISLRRKIYYEKNKERIKAYIYSWKKVKLATDIEFKLKERLRGRVYDAITKGSKAASTLELLGCSSYFLKQHLQNQFTKGMNWENYGYYGWHIDHIKPCASFDLTDPEQQRACFHYTNLQPLWAKDNLKKSNKIGIEYNNI